MEERINDKLTEIEEAITDLENLEIPEFEEYIKNKMLMACCERYFERIIEGVISLAFLIIRHKKLNSPESEEQAFFILAKNNIISETLAKKLKEAKDMRNIIVHNYEIADYSIVYHAITEEILIDAEEFLNKIKLVLV